MSGNQAQEHRWLQYASEVRAGEHPDFGDQWQSFNEVYQDWRDEDGPPPAWLPDGRDSNLARFMADKGIGDYREFHAWTTENRAEFWGEVIDRLGIVFDKKPSQNLDETNGAADPVWLPGAKLNIADSCFESDPDAPAIITGQEGTDQLKTTTQSELKQLASRVANGLKEQGFKPGDAIALYMPMTAECVAAYLGIVMAGCRVVSIADSFSASELQKRLEIADAKGIVTVDVQTRGGKAIPMYAKVIEADGPLAIIIKEDPGTELSKRSGDLLWQDFLSDNTACKTQEADPYDCINILFSSGTTGTPKAIPWTHLTPTKCAMDGMLHQDIHPGDVVAWPTNIGWMMGPWLIFAALINRATIALYEGIPTGPRFTRFIQDAQVTMLGVVPALVRAWRSSDAMTGINWSQIRTFSSTGEPSNREDYLWLMSQAGYTAPVIEYLGGTEIGGGHLTGPVVQPASPAAFSTLALGLDAVLLDENSTQIEGAGMGELYLIPPSIGLSQSVLNRDHHEIYYKDCPELEGKTLRRHGDEIMRLHQGYWRAQGRADDTMNLGGIKVSSLELERELNTHPAVYEAAAVAVQPGGEGAEQLVVFAVLRGTEPEDLKRELGRIIAKQLNPLFKISDVVVVESLPRTASNKLMRRVLRKQYGT
jgi:acetyl-CoA synthetase